MPAQKFSVRCSEIVEQQLVGPERADVDVGDVLAYSEGDSQRRRVASLRSWLGRQPGYRDCDSRKV